MMKLRRIMIAIVLIFAGSQANSTDNHLIGTLFFTPEQRDQIDNSDLFDHSTSGTAPVQVAPGSLQFNGSVRRSSGRSTAWVSGERLEKVTPSGDVLDLELAEDRLIVEQRAGKSILKAGETLTTRDAEQQVSPLEVTDRN